VPTTSFSDGEDSGSEAMRSSQWREFRRGAQIRNLATSSRCYVGLSGFGIAPLSEEPIEC
jgi:3,4-dihydroxy 2-butanone 4-phosphate synthase / GTP cyclohydrolase II